MLGGGGDGSKGDEKERERKVYSRRSFKGLEHSGSSSNLLREQPQPMKAQAPVPEGLNSAHRVRDNSGFDVGSDNFSGLSPKGLLVKGEFLAQDNKVRISLSMKSKREAMELKRKLEGERDMVRNLMRKLEVSEVQKSVVQGFDNKGGDRVAAETEQQPRMVKPLKPLSVSVYENSKMGADNGEKEKRTPKANKLYRNSEFLLAKDKICQPEGNKKLKSNGKKGGIEIGIEKFPNQVVKSCNVLLERLMKHKHGWVFNKPVDPVALGLHDYFEIIKNPMDLGTVKVRLNQNRYKSPMEFAEDVRLTFQNAMTYNPKGQDVYVMAEQLSKIFEEKWALIEADYGRGTKIASDPDVVSPTPASRKALLQSRAGPQKKRPNEKSESMAHSIAPKGKMINPAQSGKARVPKKPKAKDPNKREMTYDEKQKLSDNLQSLPAEKLDNVVQIIKKRNPSVSQQDDEIEVDIDSIDTETLWELDRFITNYKKNLSKDKKFTDIANQSATDHEQNSKEKITNSDALEAQRASRSISMPHVEVKEPEHTDANPGICKSESDSDSGSSSTDSDGESLSADGSDGGHSPKK